MSLFKDTRNVTNSSGWAAANSVTTIYPSAASFADSLESTAQAINAISAIRVNCWGRLPIAVPAGTTRLTVVLASNCLAETSGFDVSCPVYIDGAYSSTIVPSGSNAATLQQFTLTLDGAPHTVEIWNGYEVFLQGTYVYAVSGNGISVVPPTSPNSKLVVYGDSISVGGASSPPGQLSWFARMRAIFPGKCALEAFGGRQLWDDSGSGGGQLGFASQALLAARLVGLAGGSSLRQYWIAIGINDSGGAHWTAAQFGTNYATLVDALHAADPTAPIYAQSMVLTSAREGTVPAWRTQIQTVAAARPWCTFVDGTAIMAVGGLSADGLHPSTTGHQAIALGTGAAAGTTSIRSVLGV